LSVSRTLRRLVSPRRNLVLTAAVAVLVVAGGVAGGLLLTGSTPALLPTYGADVGALTRTCTTATIPFTAISGRECKKWDTTGPVNVIIVFHNRDPFAELTHHTDGKWRAAQGNWLVAQGFTTEVTKGCDDNWRDSTLQAENRVNGHDRHHLKLIYMSCTQDDGTQVAFGDAHTDHYDLQHCGGDALADFDQSLDAVIASFRADSHAHVDIRTIGKPGSYPTCNHPAVTDDGRVAFISIDD
jgi:hypothetical protein